MLAPTEHHWHWDMLAHEPTWCPAKDPCITLRCSSWMSRTLISLWEVSQQTNWSEWQPPNIWLPVSQKTRKIRKLRKTSWPRLALTTRKDTCEEIGTTQFKYLSYVQPWCCCLELQHLEGWGRRNIAPQWVPSQLSYTVEQFHRPYLHLKQPWTQ